ncbi:MAG: MFS transporter [Sporomusaceae bacterium]|nr:MFS transporter [Sporomusaceae bacterium]
MANFSALFKLRQFQNIALCHLNTTLGMNLLIPVLPVFLHNQGFSETQIGLIMGATAASSLLVRPWVGIQVDTRGSRPIILFGQILLFLSVVGYLGAAGFWTFVALRSLFGLALAFYNTGAVTFASSIGTGDLNASAIAMYTLTTMVGLGISMSFAQIAFERFGFTLLIVLSAILVAGAFAVMKFRQAPALVRGGGSKRSSFTTVLKDKVVLAVTAGQFGASFSFGALFTFIPLASLAEGISFYSLFYIAFAVFVILSRLFVQKVDELFGVKKAAEYSALLMLLGLVLLVIKLSPLTLLAAGILFGLGFGIVFPTLVLILVKGTDGANRGTALGIMTAAGDIANALSTAVLGGVAEHFGYVALFLAASLVLLGCIYYFYSALSKKEAGQV